MSEQVAVHLTIAGKVQGVFFRVETQKTAGRFGVVGWVRNRADGTVESLAEGFKEDVDAFVAWCREGAPISHVDRVDLEWKTYTGKFGRFDITY